MSNFQLDLERGVSVENKVIDLIREKYPCACRILGDFKDYDIWIPEISAGIEVKYDPRSNETNNFVIEIESRDSLSGLLTTKAKFWVLYDDNAFCVIKPSEIIKCIFLNKLTYSEFFCSGDNFKKKAFFIKKEMLSKYASKVLNTSI